jgi:glutathionylspermidine synthase
VKRIVTDWRPNWQATVEAQGFPFHSGGERPADATATYWFEGAYYELSLDEVNVIEAATAELHGLCLKAVERLCTDPASMTKFGIPQAYAQMAVTSWRRGDPTLYGRFDLAYDGHNPPKLLEYNADTPTALIETSIIQWHWLGDKFNGTHDQFNSVHEKLIDTWRAIGRRIGTQHIYFSCIKDNVEEFATVEYLRDTASQAGINTRFLYLDDVGWRDGNFVDLANVPIRLWFKLYPWEWIWREEFGKHLPGTIGTLGILEPPWKMLLSNKAILPLLWDMFPGHENLLEAHWDKAAFGHTRWIAKPTLGREGANIALGDGDETPGPYGDAPKIYQQLATLPEFDGRRAVIGSWIIGDQPAGICFREDERPIVTNSSPLVPHVFRPDV